MSPAITIVGLYNYDNTIFDELYLPDGVDKDIVINLIMLGFGGCESYIQDPNVLKMMIGWWSKSCKYAWDGLVKSTQFDYNPIENYDRKEKFLHKTDDVETVNESGTEKFEKSGTTTEKRSGTNTVTESGTRKTQESGTRSRQESGSRETVTSVSAYNSENWSNDRKEVTTPQDYTETETPNITTTETPDITTTETPDITVETTPDTVDTRTPDIEHKTTRDNKTIDAGRAHGNIGVTTTQQMIEEERRVVQFSVEQYIADAFADKFIITVF